MLLFDGFMLQEIETFISGSSIEESLDAVDDRIDELTEEKQELAQKRKELESKAWKMIEEIEND